MNHHASAIPGPTRRVAALAAVAAPAVSVVVVVAALNDSVGVVVLAIGLVLVTNAATWSALTTRGARRVPGLVIAVLAAAGLIVVLVANWHGVVVLVVLVGLVGAFGAAARYALGAPHVDTRPVSVTEAPGPAALIVNLKSGGGKAERFDLVAEAQRRGIATTVLRPGDDLLVLAERAIDAGAQVIGMAGGDGSQALVATVAARRDVAHVCIPAGTRNHFALDLGLDRDDVVGALDAFTDGVERRIDLAQVNGRVFVNNASLGVYAKVVQSAEYRDAKLETWTRLLPELLGPEADPIDLQFSAPDGSGVDDVALVLVSNNPYELSHLSGAGTRARIDTGELGVVAARAKGAHVARLVALELAGQGHRFRGLMSWSARELVVRSGGPVEVGLDGEALVMDPPLRFESLPGALRVRVPRSAGAAPAARAVRITTGNLTALLRLAAGR